MPDLSNPGTAILTFLLLLVWITILAWLSTMILRFCDRRYGWGVMNWRSWLACFGVLVGTIHIGNYALDLLDRALGNGQVTAQFTMPGAFLMGSVAIGVVIAVIRERRSQGIT